LQSEPEYPGKLLLPSLEFAGKSGALSSADKESAVALPNLLYYIINLTCDADKRFCGGNPNVQTETA
jgi:hypothetical protein